MPARRNCFSPNKSLCRNNLEEVVPLMISECYTRGSRSGGCGMPLLPTENTVRFGRFELDLRTRQLTRNGAKIRLSQQPIQVLSLLLETPGEIVTREEFRRRLWSSDVFVDINHGLNKSIQKLEART